MTRTHPHANDNRPAWFDELLLKYDPFIRKRCFTLDPRNADDLHQDVVLRAIERWYRYKRDGNFVTWVGFLVGEIRNKRREKRVRAEKYPFFIQPGVAPAAQEHFVDVELSLRAVSPVERASLELESVGYNTSEVASLLGFSRQRAWEALDLGRRKLNAANDNEARAD